MRSQKDHQAYTELRNDIGRLKIRNNWTRGQVAWMLGCRVSTVYLVERFENLPGCVECVTFARMQRNARRLLSTPPTAPEKKGGLFQGEATHEFPRRGETEGRQRASLAESGRWIDNIAV